MKTKNFVIEVIEGAEGTRTFIIRELVAPNLPPVTKCVTSDVAELAQFFDAPSMFPADDQN